MEAEKFVNWYVIEYKEETDEGLKRDVLPGSLIQMRINKYLETLVEIGDTVDFADTITNTYKFGCNYDVTSCAKELAKIIYIDDTLEKCRSYLEKLEFVIEINNTNQGKQSTSSGSADAAYLECNSEIKRKNLIEALKQINSKSILDKRVKFLLKAKRKRRMCHLYDCTNCVNIAKNFFCFGQSLRIMRELKGSNMTNFRWERNTPYKGQIVFLGTNSTEIARDILYLVDWRRCSLATAILIFAIFHPSPPEFQKKQRLDDIAETISSYCNITSDVAGRLAKKMHELLI